MRTSHAATAGKVWVVLIFCLALSLTSCRRVSEATRAQNTRRNVESYGQLELTAQTRHQGLRDELSRLAGENATPAQLTAAVVVAADGVHGLRRGGRIIPDHQNAAPAMLAAIADNRRAALKRQLDDAYPRGGEPDDPRRLASLRQIRDKYGNEATAFRKALSRPECEFGFQFTHGLLADLSFIEVALLGNRLLGIEAHLALAADDASSATALVRDMLDVTGHLAAVQNITARVAAARMRTEAFELVGRIARHPRARPQDLDSIYGKLEEQWTDWPAETDAWSGERAVGMHAYEMVRDGQLLSILTFEEMAEQRRLGLEQFCVQVYNHVDEDESFYLRTMRDVVEASRTPYFERRPVLEKLEKHLEQLAVDEARPRVAMLLLKQLDWSQRNLARDRALLEGWSIAFAKATGRSVPDGLRHPLTGKPYMVVEQKHWIEVFGVDVPGDNWPAVVEPLVVPRVDNDLKTVPASSPSPSSPPRFSIGDEATP